MPGFPHVSVIVCAYTEERWEDLLDAVESLRSQTVSPHQIIVAVDHNPSLAARVRATMPAVVVVENHEPPGLSGTRNSGVAAATGDVVAFIDDDAYASPEWVEHIGNAYSSEDILGVGGSIDPVWPGKRPKWFPEEFHWVVGCTYRGLPQTSSAIRNMIGCNMSFRRQVLQGTDGFRTSLGKSDKVVGTYPLGCEETELCIRALQRWPQGKILYTPEARVMHKVPESRVRWGYFWERCYQEGLSKVLVARSVGARDGLSSERAYALRTLPAGFWRGVADTFLRGDLSGLARSAAIAAGLAFTSAGYMVGSLSVALRKN